MENLFNSVEQNAEPQETEITGKIPEWVEGQLFRIGPAKWDFEDGFTYNHWLDGCALMYKFRIRNGHVDVMSRFLDTESYRKVTEINRPVYTEFGTKSYPDPCKNIFSRFLSKMIPLDLTDNVMANVFTVEDEMYASTETARLWKVNPDDLNCTRKTDLRDVMAINMASSHPHRSSDGTVYNLGASFLTGLRYQIFKIPPRSMPDVDEYEGGSFDRASVFASIASAQMTSFSYYHSFGLTERYVLFLEQPLLMNFTKMAISGIQGYSFKDCFEWHPEMKVRFHLIDRFTGQELETRYQAEPFFFFHHVNTYEEDGHVITDLFTFPDSGVIDKFYMRKLRMGEYDDSCQCIFTRFVLPLNTENSEGGNLVSLKNTTAKATIIEDGIVFLESETKGEAGYEMPSINYAMFNSKKYRFMYGSGVFEKGKFANSLLKMDVESGETILWKESSTMYPGESIYVPKPGSTEEDDGVLLTVVLDVAADSRDFLMVLDARTFKELGRAYVPRTIQLPPTVHGLFLSD